VPTEIFQHAGRLWMLASRFPEDVIIRVVALDPPVIRRDELVKD